MTYLHPTITVEKALTAALDALKEIERDPHAGKAARFRARKALGMVSQSDVRQTAQARVSALQPARL